MATTTNRIRPLLFAAALYTAAGGYVHAQQWWEGYRNISTVVPGWWVVRVGFPVAALTAVVLAVALLAAMRWRRLTTPVLLAAIVFNGVSLAALIATRAASLFGWSERVWTTGANQARATEIGALVVLFLSLLAARAYAQQTAPRLVPATAGVRGPRVG